MREILSIAKIGIGLIAITLGGMIASQGRYAIGMAQVALCSFYVGLVIVNFCRKSH